MDFQLIDDFDIEKDMIMPLILGYLFRALRENQKYTNHPSPFRLRILYFFVNCFIISYFVFLLF